MMEGPFHQLKNFRGVEVNSEKMKRGSVLVALDRMDEDFLEESLRLALEVRKDLKELVKLWTFRSFEDLHSASGFHERMHMGVEQVSARLEILERAIRKEDFATISREEWPVYDLVNYYDRLIDLVRQRELSSGRDEGTMRSLRKWRDTAGLFAQKVCHMEDLG